MTPEEEVRFWRRFYARSMELFGDKKGGTLKEMTAKAMQRLKFECEMYATTTRPDGWDRDKAGPFNSAELKAQGDEKARKEWSHKMAPSPVVWHYLALIHNRHASPEAAVKAIAEAFKFQSYGAAASWLKDHGAEPLPPNWSSPRDKIGGNCP